MAEGSVSIMAASIPVMRTLIKEVATTRRYYASKSDPNQTGTTENSFSKPHRETYRASISATSTPKNGGETRFRSDNDSDESILDIPGMPVSVPENCVIQMKDAAWASGER